MNDEHSIEILTKEITLKFQGTQRDIKAIGAAGKAHGGRELKMTKGIMSTLAQELQALSGSFRSSQASYLKRMRMIYIDM